MKVRTIQPVGNGNSWEFDVTMTNGNNYSLEAKVLSFAPSSIDIDVSEVYKSQDCTYTDQEIKDLCAARLQSWADDMGATYFYESAQ